MLYNGCMGEDKGWFGVDNQGGLMQCIVYTIGCRAWLVSSCKVRLSSVVGPRHPKGFLFSGQNLKSMERYWGAWVGWYGMG